MRNAKAQMIKELEKLNKDIATAIEHKKAILAKKCFKETK